MVQGRKWLFGLRQPEGPTEIVWATWPLAIVQTCSIHPMGTVAGHCFWIAGWLPLRRRLRGRQLGSCLIIHWHLECLGSDRPDRVTAGGAAAVHVSPTTAGQMNRAGTLTRRVDQLSSVFGSSWLREVTPSLG